MESQEFRRIRKYLGKTQSTLARLLCISTKSVQSFEQGWRNIPPHIERQLLYLLSIYKSKDKYSKPCWEIKNCPIEWRHKCAAWELEAGNTCWFINGTYCEGVQQKGWYEKINICRECEVYKAVLPPSLSPSK
jgi:DNA-binding XRE family transcriptional regulator